MFFIDGHCDSITEAMSKNENMYKNTCKVNFEKLSKFNAPVQVFSIWLNKELLKKPFENTVKALEFYKNEIKNNSNLIENAFCYDDIIKNINSKKATAIAGIEGGEAIENKMENFEFLYNNGVRILTITWNNENCLGYGVNANEKKGLKPFGKKIINAINKNNMIVDVSHLNERGFWDVCDISNKGFIVSHSNIYEVCRNKRNINKKQIKAVIDKKGIIGINLYTYFLNNTNLASIKDIIKHIDYLLEMGAEDFIGIGCDFDGADSFPEEFNDVFGLFELKKKLCKEYGVDISEKIMGKNYLKFFKEQWQLQKSVV